VKKFLASLLNEPWLIEEAWLEMMVQSFLGGDPTADPKMLEILKSDRLMGTRSATIRGSKAIVPIHGPIFARPNFLTEYLGIGMTLTDFTQDVQNILDNPDVESILLDVDSPGGTVTGINEASNFIAEASKEKPITAYIGGVGASAAYWLASAADEIVLDATSRVGSVGVVVAYPNPQEDNDGYIEIVNTASPNKRPDVSTEQGKKVITAELDDLADVFIGTIAKNRGVSEVTVRSDFGKGGVLVGQKAVSAGMADRLGSFEELMAENNKYEEGDFEMKLTVDKLKADHKDVYDQVVASVTPDTSAKDAEIAAAKAALEVSETEKTELATKLAASKTSEEGLSTRVVALEKRDVLRDEEALKTQASGIMTGALTASSIPERIHSKVTPIDYNKHMTDGKLDVAAFTAAVDAEVKEWEDTLGSAEPIQGITSPPKADDVAADDDVVARLLGHVQTKKEA